MAIRAKTKRRLVLFVSALVFLCLLGGGAYAYRMHRLRVWLDRLRVEGLAAFKAGDYQATLEKLYFYIQEHPTDAETLYPFAQSRLKVTTPDGKYLVQAASLLVRVLDIQPDNVEARRTLLDIYGKIERHTEALSTADWLLKKDPKDGAALYAKAVALGRLNRLTEALKVSQQHNEVEPLSLEGQSLTLRIMAQSKVSAAQIHSRAADLLKAHPNDARFELLQGIALQWAPDPSLSLKDNDDKVVAWFRKAASRDVSDPTLLTQIAYSLNSCNLYEESLNVLQKAAEKGGNPQIRRALIARLWELNRWQEVVDRLANLDLKSPSTDAQLLAFRASALIRLDRRGEAAPLIEALAARKGEPLATTWAAVLPVFFGADKLDAKQGLAVSRDAIQRHPGNPYFHYDAGEALALLGENEMALTQWDQAAQLAPAWAAPLSRMAMALPGQRAIGPGRLGGSGGPQPSAQGPRGIGQLCRRWLAGCCHQQKYQANPRSAQADRRNPAPPAGGRTNRGYSHRRLGS